MHRIIEDLSQNDSTVTLDGRSYPCPSLVEDADGVRALVLSDREFVPAHVWAQAHALGAAYLIAAGEPVLAMTAEDFIERRTDDARYARYRVNPGAWIEQAVALPTYRDVVYTLRPDNTTVPEMAAEAVDTATITVEGFVNVHTHFEYSALDGLSKVSEAVEAAVADGQMALGSADHGNCAVHPELQERCDEAGIKPIFGMEAYFVPDRHRRGRNWLAVVDPDSGAEWEVPDDYAGPKDTVKRSDSREALNEYTHICLWAMDQEGLRNLWAMSTESYVEGFYGKPRIDWDTLTRLGAGVLASTGCLRGPVSQALLAGDGAKAREVLARMLHIFGDRLYVEIHTNHLDEQMRVNPELVALAREMGVPLLAAVDSHYAKREDREVHRAWLAMQQHDKDVTDDSSLFAGGQDYHMKSEAEVREALAYLGADVVEEAVANTAALANRCTAKVVGATSTPTYSKPSTEHPDPIQRDVERLLDLCLSNWERKCRGKRLAESVYEERFEREMRLLIDKQFCGYFLVVADYVNWAKEQGCLVGPGRGSGGGSLVAYLAGIVEIDPVDAGLIFERFLTEGRKSLPDFDIDFPTSWRPRITDYVIRRWGAEHVSRIGTITRLQSKGAFNDSARVLKPTLPFEVAYTDAQALKKAIDAADAPLAGKHMPWDQFCVEFADVVDPLRAKYPEVFTMTDTVVTRVKSYSKHAAGMVISTDSPLTDLPLRVDDEGMLVTQFDMGAVERLGYVKFDFLTLRTLDTIQQTVDLIEERFGHRINVYGWTEEYEDPQVWEQVAAGSTLGIFQIETAAGTRLTKDYRPDSVQGLAAVMTLVRPGPKRSGLTDIYLRRRAGLEPVSFPDPRMADVLGETYGAIIYQEQVMAACMLLAGYDSTKADEVRKILGKKKVELVASAGAEFVAAASERGMSRPDAEHLWEQLAEFAKYGFGKAHAFGYAVLGYWTAWLKFHFPVQFLTAALSTVKDERMPEFVNEARRMGYAIGGPDINESRINFTPTDMMVRYGLAKVSGVGEGTAAQIVAGQPYTSLEDFTDRMLTKGSKVDSGHLSKLVAVGAFDSLVPNRRAVEMQLEAEKTGANKTCVFKDLSALGPGGLPCTFDWANEPDPPMQSKGRGKAKVQVAKPPPKKCTVACRQYRKPEPISVDLISPYTEADIRDREKQLLGVWLSSTPFDRLDPEDLSVLHTAADMEAGPAEREYTCAAIVERVSTKVDRNGGTYAWVTLDAQNGPIDAICFSRTFEKSKAVLRQDALVLALVWKTDKGFNLTAVAPAC